MGSGAMHQTLFITYWRRNNRVRIDRPYRLYRHSGRRPPSIAFPPDYSVNSLSPSGMSSLCKSSKTHSYLFVSSHDLIFSHLASDLRSSYLLLHSKRHVRREIQLFFSIIHCLVLWMRSSIRSWQLFRRQQYNSSTEEGTLEAEGGDYIIAY